MDIFPTLATRQDTTAATGLTSDRAMLTADFQTFLQLLTAQLENQDPLNPMESTEFTTQLATFSGVEQQVQTNELLTDMQNSLGALGMGDLGGWVGMEARVIAPVAHSGTPISVQADLNPLADRMDLVVLDEAGVPVQRMPIPLSDAPFEWDGTAPDGTSLMPGTYVLSVESWQGETLLGTRPATIRAEIEEALMVNGNVWLTLEGGTQVPADEILGLREGLDAPAS